MIGFVCFVYSAAMFEYTASGLSRVLVFILLLVCVAHLVRRTLLGWLVSLLSFAALGAILFASDRVGALIFLVPAVMQLLSWRKVRLYYLGTGRNR